MKNEYWHDDKNIHIRIDSPKYGVFYTKVSVKHLDRLRNLDRSITLRFDSRMNSFYAVFKKNNKSVPLHRWITDAPPGTHVDHQNSNTLDNSDENLHVCSPTENKQKKRKNRTNTSGVIGVYWSKQNQKWKAQIRSLGKSYHVGYFDDIQEAEEAIRTKKKELWGFYA